MSTTQNSRTVKGRLARSRKEFFTPLCFFVLLGLAPASLIAAPYQQATGPSGRVSIEAEGFDAKVSKGGKSWTNTYPSGFSGTKALVTTPNSGTRINTGYASKSPRLDYVVNFVKTGVHYVWIRGAGPSGGDDSLHVGLDGAELATSNSISNFSKGLSWTNTHKGGNITTINVTTTGKHTLNVWMREDGTVFDKIVLTKSSTYTPTNKGPSVSVRSATGSTSDEPIATLSKSNLNFGSQEVGGISDPSRVKLTNSGTAPLYISSITTTSSDFIQTNNCGGAVAVGSSCVIKVKFVPTSTGAVSSRLNVSSNAGNSILVHLTGTGADGSLQPLSSLTPSGRIVINGERDVVISGLHISNPNGSCIKILNGASNIVIKDSIIGPCGNKGVYIQESSHVTITGNYINDVLHEGVWSNKSNDITVDSNMIEDVESGYEGWSTSIGNLSFTNNVVKNVTRRVDSSNGGNVAMLAYVHGGGIRINNNIGINIPGESSPEDLINLYQSSGKPDDPIQVNNNKLYGGGPSTSGAGIILGDDGGSYQEARNNILVNPAQSGLGMSQGHHLTMTNNKVFSDNKRSFTNVGVGIGWSPSQSGGICENFEFSNNEITFYKGSHFTSHTPYLNSAWKWSKCDVSGWNTNKFDTPYEQPANLDMSLWNPDWNNP